MLNTVMPFGPTSIKLQNESKLITIRSFISLGFKNEMKIEVVEKIIPFVTDRYEKITSVVAAKHEQKYSLVIYQPVLDCLSIFFF